MSLQKLIEDITQATEKYHTSHPIFRGVYENHIEKIVAKSEVDFTNPDNARAVLNIALNNPYAPNYVLASDILQELEDISGVIDVINISQDYVLPSDIVEILRKTLGPNFTGITHVNHFENLFIYAASKGNAALVKSFLAHGVNVNVRYSDRKKNTAEENEKDHIKEYESDDEDSFIAPASFDVPPSNGTISDGGHPLDSGHHVFDHKLPLTQPALHYRDGKSHVGFVNGITALQIAAEAGHKDVCATLLSHGADTNIVDENTVLPAFGFAVCNGHDDVVSLFLDLKVSLQPPLVGPFQYGYSYLMLASQTNQPAIAQLLIKNGAEVNKHIGGCTSNRFSGFRALDFAIVGDATDAMEVLLSNGANPNTCNPMGIEPAMEAIRWGKEAALRKLLDHGAYITEEVSYNIVDSQGVQQTIVPPNRFLQESVDLGFTKIAKCLLENGAKVSNEFLHKAALSRSKDMCAVLLDHGADVNAADRYGNGTALHIATTLEICELLLAHGAAVDATDNLDRTALHMAISKQPAIALSLLMHCANPNAADADGNTALHLASEFNSLPLIELLLKLDSVNFDFNALHSWTVVNHKDDLTEVLENNGYIGEIGSLFD